MKAPRSLKEVRSSLTAGDYNLIDLVRFYLDNIEQKSDLNAFLEVWKDEVLEQAEQVQSKIDAGTAGRLAGMVVGLKDNIVYKGHKVSASSKILEGFESLYSSTVTERLEAEDALFIGRLNCDEFAMGSSNENSAFGPVKNPHNPACVSGGSSGGSATAVAADMCLVSFGSDTGGSIRQPASFCGVVGLKPTYGRVSRHGLIAYASSMDQIGPFTHSVEDAALVLEVIAGKDNFDNTASTKVIDDYASFTPISNARIAVIEESLNSDGLDSEVKTAINTQIEKLRADGHTVEMVSFPYLDELVPCYNVLSNAEASSNLSRFDGMRYGYRSENAVDVPTTYSKSRTEGFGKEVKRRIMLGTFVLSTGYYDAYYSKAQKVRRLIQEKTDEILQDFDFILTPTSPHTAFKFGENSHDPVAMYLEDIYTVQANLAGIPGVSLPLYTHSNGMPFGLQLMANKFEEKKLLSFSKQIVG
ncbi:MAG: Asp-tRNA(Asn)/Glu-tRNA(Gln) amidotransferase GatCAB subunit A [Crocinitomicaceae bacterium]|nr:Asp-tRNA(Asn)/Glu-tRNA(Gln) amidotransferase GatCAB subunit A [Crocinitomicaceae bacterium]|tara:strand:- start:4942 stop:6357 length:1416 start_codon:yes stop_codon:yes gene_type:complete